MLLSVIYKFTNHQPEILFEISIDDQVQVSSHADAQEHRLDHEFADSDIPQTKVLKLVMSGKNETHTIVDDNNQIVSDSAVEIQKIILDDIDVTDELCKGLKCYQHNNNGSTDTIMDEFYGYMGQNGTVTWSFELPLYKWFLDQCR